jgi:hypothetical protein
VSDARRLALPTGTGGRPRSGGPQLEAEALTQEARCGSGDGGDLWQSLGGFEDVEDSIEM